MTRIDFVTGMRTSVTEDKTALTLSVWEGLFSGKLGVVKNEGAL